MGTYCAPLIADLLLFCYERDFAFLFNCKHGSTHIRQYQSSFSDESDLHFPFCWFIFVGLAPGVAFVILDRFDGLFFHCSGRWQNLDVLTPKM